MPKVSESAPDAIGIVVSLPPAKVLYGGQVALSFLLKSIEFSERIRKPTRARERSIETEIFNLTVAEILCKHDVI